MQTNSVNPYLTTTDVLETLRDSCKPTSQWGRALDGTPILSARTGGHKQPTIFITAGAHADETAGVHAALNLLDLLGTEHEVHILPLRDPFGFAGAVHCLSFAAGKPVKIGDHAETLQYLKDHAMLVWHENEMYIFKLGEIGFVWNPLQPGIDNYWAMMGRISKLVKEDPSLLKPLSGKSVMLINSADIDGARAMQRCWHAVLSEEMEWLHLNRFFGRSDAPPETAAVDHLMQTLHPGLTCDLHEGNGEGFWIPIPKPERNLERVLKMSCAYFSYIASCGYPVESYEHWLATDHTSSPDPNWMVPETSLPGLFWVKTTLRGEGPNLMDYACQFGVAYGTEAPMEQPLAMRVDGITHGIQAAIKVWEETLPKER
jgi:hypothetical protein